VAGISTSGLPVSHCPMPLPISDALNSGRVTVGPLFPPWAQSTSAFVAYPSIGRVPKSSWTDISSLFRSLFSTAFRDYFKFFAIGAVFESCRRLGSYAYSHIVRKLYITATFESDYEVYCESVPVVLVCGCVLSCFPSIGQPV